MYAPSGRTRLAACLAAALAGLLAQPSLLPAQPKEEPVLRAFLEAEAFSGAKEKGWRVVAPRAAGEVSGSYVAVAAGELPGPRTAKLPRNVGIGETVKLFLRVRYGGGGANLVRLSLGGAVANVRWTETAPKDAWLWTPGVTVKAPVAQEALTLRVLEVGGEGLAVDCVYLTSDTTETSPPHRPGKGTFSVARVERHLASAEKVESLRPKLTFYAPFDRHPEALLAAGQTKPTNPGLRFNYETGLVGDAVAVTGGKIITPSYKVEGNFSQARGTLAFWHKPAWEGGRKPDGYPRIFSARGRWRWYMMCNRLRLSTSTMITVEGEMKWSGAGGPLVHNWAPGQWRHVAVIWGDGKTRWYIDGYLAHENTNDSGFRVDPTGSFHLGDPQLEGLFDELAIWSEPLKAERIAALAVRGRRGEPLLTPTERQRAELMREYADSGVEDRAPNRIQNGSFEAGASRWLRCDNGPQWQFVSPYDHPDEVRVTEDDAWHGKRSLRFRVRPAGDRGTRVWSNAGMVRTLAFRLHPDRECLAQCWVKVASGGPVKATLRVAGVRQIGRAPRSMGRAVTLEAGGGWQCISLSGRPGEATDKLYFLALKLTNTGDEDAICLIDGLQVAPQANAVETGTFSYLHAVTGALSTEKLANVFKPDEPAVVQVSLANQSAQKQPETFVIEAFDLWDRKVHSREIPADFELLERRDTAVDLGETGMGIFRVVLSREDGGQVVDEMVVSVLPQRPVAGLGNHAFWDDYSLEVCKRMGITWNRCWDNQRVTSLMTVMPEKAGEFNFARSDERVNNGLRHGMELLGMLDWPWGPKWAYNWVSGKRPHWLLTEWHKDHPSSVLRDDLIDNEEFMGIWDRYVHETVKHFKGRITHWEILNEPYATHSSQWVLRLYKRTIPLIKKANPDAVIVGPCAYIRPSWMDGLIQGGLLDMVDVFSYHGYGMDTDALAAMERYAHADGKDRPTFDTENSGHASSQFFARSWLGAEYSGYSPAVRGAARMSSNYLRGRGEGLDVYFYYWMRLYDAYNKYSTFVECDGSLKANGVGYAIAGWMIRGLEPRAKMMIGRNVRCYVFADPGGNRAVAAMWDERDSSSLVRFRGDAPGELRNVMGNAIDPFVGDDGAASVQVTAFPTYVVGDSADRLTEAMEQAGSVALGLEEVVVGAHVAVNAENEPSLVVDLYNNSVTNQKGTLRLKRLPEGMRAAATEKEFDIPVNDRSRLAFPLEAVPPVMRRAGMEWSIVDTAGPDVSGTVELSGFLAPYRENLKLDDPKAWAGLPAAALNTSGQVQIGGDNWNGPEDCSATVRAAWDKRYLYVEVTVRDDRFIPPPHATWSRDGAELFINSDLSPLINENNHQLFFTPRTASGKGFDAMPKGALAGLEGTGSTTEDGYRIAVRAPLEKLKIRPAIGSAIGFDVAVNDQDQPDKGRKLSLLWAGTGNNYRDPSRLGRLVLVGKAR